MASGSERARRAARSDDDGRSASSVPTRVHGSRQDSRVPGVGAVDEPTHGGYLTEDSRRSRLLFLTGGAALAIATVALFLVSRGKWSDAMIDSGREWIVPDALARGELLYRDVVYWFGPFTPYFHGTMFGLFGSSFSVLVVAGVIGSIATIAALYFALRRVASRTEALLWSALAIPALVFMPNSGGAVLGMGYRMWHAATFALLAVGVLVGPARAGPGLRTFLAGALAGLAGLCRTEWGLVTLLVTALVVLQRDGDRRQVWKDGLGLAGGFLLVFGGVFVLFGIAAGWRALLHDAPVLLFNLPLETRSNVALAGSSAWPAGVWTLLYSAAMWCAVFLLMEIVALRRVDPSRARRRLPWLGTLLAIFAVTASIGGALSGGLIWSAAPLLCAVACLVGLRTDRGPTAAALFGYGLLGVLLSHRRFFFIADGPYVGPPLLFALVSAAGLCSMAVAREKDSAARQRLRVGVAVLVALLIGVAFAVRFVEYRTDERVAIRGTAGLITARRELAREIEDLGAAIRAGSPADGGLVVFPEGEIFNYLSGRRNPIRHKLYLPGYLNAGNEGEILAELEAARPSAVVVWNRPLGEYGAGSFGEDYGGEIRRWIDRSYERRPFRADALARPSVFENYVRRDPLR